MNKVASAVQAYLKSQDWRFSFDEDRNVFDFKMAAKNCDSIRVLIIAKETSICTYAILPIKVPEEQRVAAAEFEARANFGLNIGNMELDMTDGEVRYKSSLCCSEDSIPSMRVIERSVDLAFMMLDRYAKGLLRLVYGGMSTEEAVELAEKN